MKKRLRKKLLSAQIDLLTAKAAKLPAGAYKDLIEAQAKLAALRLQELSDPAELVGEAVSCPYEVLFNLHFSLRSMLQYISASRQPLLWFPDNKTPITDLHDYKLAVKTVEQAGQLLLDIKAMHRTQLVNAASEPGKVLGKVVAVVVESADGVQRIEHLGNVETSITFAKVV